MAKFVFNRKELKFDALKITFGRVVKLIVKYLLLSLLLAAAYYLLFAVVTDTPRERQLAAENARLQESHDSLLVRMEMLDNVIKGLQYRDRDIYAQIFDAMPPDYLLMASDTSRLDFKDILFEDETDLTWSSYVRVKKGETEARMTAMRLDSIAAVASADSAALLRVPSIFPIRDFNIAQTGASVGRKVNPFFKIIRDHEGIDLLSPAGMEVVCTADGIVEEVVKSEKGLGNIVTVDHGNGLKTRYCQLSSISVGRGQRVTRGTMVGRVGMSGLSLAPHLHYEVRKDGQPVEPVHYFFADLTPATYREMLIMALSNGQSMD